MARRRPQRPRDPSQLGKLIVDLSVGDVTEINSEPENPAIEYARKGGQKGGKARAASLTPQRRREIALNAAKRRWNGPGGKRPRNQRD